MKKPHFEYTTQGYLEAKEWLISINEWDRVSTTGFSTDGLSIIHEANAIFERLNKEK